MGPHHHPEITLTGIAMHHALAAWKHGDTRMLRSIFFGDAQKLAAAGADFFILPDNSAHIALGAPAEPFNVTTGRHVFDRRWSTPLARLNRARRLVPASGG